MMACATKTPSSPAPPPSLGCRVCCAGHYAQDCFDADFLEGAKVLTTSQLNWDDLGPPEPPRSWLDYLGIGSLKQLEKTFKKDNSQEISYTKLRGLLTTIYKMKIEQDQNSVRDEKLRLPLPEYVCIFFDNYYGLKKMAVQNMVGGSQRAPGAPPTKKFTI